MRLVKCGFPVAVLFVFAGCATQGPTNNVVMRWIHVQTHRSRPEHIKRAVMDGKLEAGMTQWEAKLAMGEPDEKRMVRSDAATENWRYEETHGGGASTLYDVTVLKASLSFTNGPAGYLLSEWRFVGNGGRAREGRSASGRWPELKLQGIVEAKGKRLAQLSGQTVEVGDMVEGAVVLFVGPDFVALTFQDEGRVLKIGECTSDAAAAK